VAQSKISLDYLQLEVGTRRLVPGDFTLSKLHHVVPAAMGRYDITFTRSCSGTHPRDSPLQLEVRWSTCSERRRCKASTMSVETSGLGVGPHSSFATPSPV